MVVILLINHISKSNVMAVGGRWVTLKGERRIDDVSPTRSLKRALKFDTAAQAERFVRAVGVGERGNWFWPTRTKYTWYLMVPWVVDARELPRRGAGPKDVAMTQTSMF